MRCHGCQSGIAITAGESVGFRAECEACGRDLHVCLNCAHHDPSAYNECREPNAERVTERDRANRCDDFRPGEDDGADPADDARAKAKAALDALFGD